MLQRETDEKEKENLINASKSGYQVQGKVVMWQVASLRLVGCMLGHAGLRRHSILVAALLDIVLICQGLLGIHLDVGHVGWHMRVLRYAGPTRLGRQVGRRVLWGVDLVIIHAVLVAVARLGRIQAGLSN